MTVGAVAELIDHRPDELLLVEAEPRLQLAETVVEPSPQMFIAVPELAGDKFTEKRIARFIGEAVTSRSVKNSEQLKHEKPINSLRDGIHWAAEGDSDGIAMVDTNIGTDMIERTLKSGHVTDPVPLTVLPGSKIMQYNQTGDAIQTNSLQLNAGHKILEPRTKAEALNHGRDEDLHREGWYENYSKLVISLGEDDPDIFFTDTMSCSLQLTSKDGANLQLESAFVAGIATPGAERHDIKTIIALGDMIGVDFRGMTIAEIIATPILIHNSLVPNGVVDVVEKLWDPATAKITGEPAFFGESKEAPCDYVEYRQRCRERTNTFKPRVILVRNQLIREKDQIKTRVQAIERLHELSEAQMVDKAIEDHSIDPRVFGGPSAEHIIMARYYEQQGMTAEAKEHTTKAKQTADSKSCPWAKAGQDTGESADDTKDATSEKSNDDTDDLGERTFKCTNGHTNRRPYNRMIENCWVPGCHNSVCAPVKKAPKEEFAKVLSLDDKRQKKQLEAATTSEGEVPKTKTETFEAAYKARAARNGRVTVQHAAAVA